MTRCSALELACCFPFLRRVSEFLKRQGATLESELSDEAKVREAVELLRALLERGAPGAAAARCECSDPGRAVVVARLALYIAAAGGPHLLKKFAVVSGKAFSQTIRSALRDQCCIYGEECCRFEIARDLGVSAACTKDVFRGRGFSRADELPVAVRWTSYLKFAPQSPQWAMINRPVVRGWVLIPDGDFTRLLEGAYEERIIELARENELAVGWIARHAVPRLVPELEELARKHGRPALRLDAVKAGEDPPCMRALVEALKAGENLPHAARFALAAYLVRRGWDVERVVDLFRSAPDFNERVTRYQVMHIAGQAGGRKQYMVPGCQTMLSWGLCPNNLACGVRNPLLYARRGSRQGSGEQRTQVGAAAP
jgi:DNA primase large subunit